jgi:hypothetical protein
MFSRIALQYLSQNLWKVNRVICRRPVKTAQRGKPEIALRQGENGAGEETRTLDVYLGKVVLYQLSYTRIACKSLCPPFYGRVSGHYWQNSPVARAFLDLRFTIYDLRFGK